MKNIYTIGEIAKLFKIKISTLRYYDEINLFKPNHVDDGSHYRYYHIDQFETLNLIVYLKVMDMSLKDISNFIKNRNPVSALNLYDDKISDIEKKIKRYEDIKEKLNQKKIQLEVGMNENLLNGFEIKKFTKRIISYIDGDVSNNAFIDLGVKKLESNSNLSIPVVTGQFGMITQKKYLPFKTEQKLFIFIDTPKERGVKILKEGMYLTYKYKGGHADSYHIYPIIMDYLEENNYVMLDDPIEVTLINFALTQKRTDFVTEIQVHIKRHH